MRINNNDKETLKQADKILNRMHKAIRTCGEEIEDEEVLEMLDDLLETLKLIFDCVNGDYEIEYYEFED